MGAAVFKILEAPYQSWRTGGDGGQKSKPGAMESARLPVPSQNSSPSHTLNLSQVSQDDGAQAHRLSTPQRDSPIDCDVDTSPPSPNTSQSGGGQHQRGESSKRRLFPTQKRAHQLSRGTPYPVVKGLLVQTKVLGADPHSGYDLCAPTRQGKYKHWVPRHMKVSASRG